MSFDTLFKAVSSGAAAVANAVAQTAQGAVDATATFIEERVEDVVEVGEAAKSGNLAGAAVEFVEGLSIGEIAKDAATSVGLLPKDGGLVAEIFSAAINFVGANPVALVKDLFDVSRELSKTPKAPRSPPPSPGQSVPRPNDHLTHQGPGTGVAGRYPTSPAPLPRPPGSIAAELGDLMKAIFEQIVKLVQNGEAMPPSASGNPPIARPAPDGSPRFDIPDRLRRDFETNPLRNGGPVLGRPLSEVTYDDILKDKSLTFEDMIFLFMSKMGSDMKKQMQDQMSDIADMNKALDNKSAEARGAGSSTAPQKGDNAKAGGFSLNAIFKEGLDGAFKDILKPENIKGFVSGALDFAKVAAPVLLPMIGTAVGTVFPGVGNVIGGVAGGAGGAALGVGLELLSGAVKTGAFDGLIEGAVGLAASGSDAKGPPASGAAKEAFDGKDKDGIERDRDFALEKLKLLQQRLTEMQQALSNILNAQHETAMNTIGNIR